MNRDVILDTGPLVAYLDRREANHLWARKQFQVIAAPILTCEAVLTETCFLLQGLTKATQQIGEWLRLGRLRIAFSMNTSHAGVFRLMRKYRNLPMSLADACLVAMIKQGIGKRILTLDNHFRIYRHSGRRVLPLLMPLE